MIKWLLALAAVAVTLALAWFAIGGSGPSPAPLAEREVGVSPPDTRAVSSNRRGQDLADAERGEAARSAVGATEADAGAEPPVPSAAGGTDTLDVLVVEAADGSPVAGVAVLFLDRTVGAAVDWQRAWDRPGDMEAFVARHGTGLHSDAGGRLRVPSTGSGALLVRTEELAGKLEWIGFPAGPLRLELVRGADLEVLVAGADGVPRPDVPVAVCRNDSRAAWNLLVRTTQGPEGIARFPRLADRLSGDPSSRAFAVGFAFPLANRELIPIDLGRLPERVRLELPPTGAVTVLVGGADGEPFAGKGVVSLGHLPVSGAGAGTAGFRAEAREVLHAGRAHFPWVGVGSDLTIRVDGVRGLEPLIAERAGPTRAGETLEIRLEWSELQRILVGRALAQGGGESLVARRGRVWIRGPDAIRSGPHFETDAEGRFRVVVDQPWVDGQERTFAFQLLAYGSAPPRDASVDLSYALEPGETDVGDVFFEALPELVTGTVRDAEGRPLVGVFVRVEPVDEPAADVPRTAPARDFRSTTAKDGRFMIHGRTRSIELSLTAIKRDYLTLERAPVIPGSRDLELVMERGQEPRSRPPRPRSERD